MWTRIVLGGLCNVGAGNRLRQLSVLTGPMGDSVTTHLIK